MLESFFISGMIPENTVNGHYDYVIVALSYTIATLVSFVALDMASNIQCNKTYTRIDKRFCIYCGAFAMGAGIWSMHFISIASYNTGIEIHYHIGKTALSMSISIALSFFVLSVIRIETLSFLHMLGTAILFGTGITAIHYVGMSATESHYDIRYIPEIAILTLIMAITLSSITLWPIFHITRNQSSKSLTFKVIAALIMGITACSMHYTHMASSVFIPLEYNPADLNTYSINTFMAFAISALTILILSIAIASSLINQKFVRQQDTLIEKRAFELTHSNTQLTETEKQSRTNEARLQLILNHIIDGVITLDEKGIIQSFNKAAENIFGYTEREIMDQNIEMLMPIKHTSPNDNFIKKYLDNTEESRMGIGGMEVEGIRKNGETFTADLGINELVVHGERLFIGVIRDITRQKKYEDELHMAKEAAERATHAKSDFLANMSHEIRTPMNAIIGMTGLLLDTPLTPEQYTHAEIVRRSGEALLDLINDILDFSKIEAGQLTLEPIPFNLYTATEEIMDLLKIKAQQQGIELLIRYDTKTPHYYVGDPGRIRQILINLMGNSIKFTTEGYVLLNVEFKDMIGDKASIFFEVQDTGIGIPREKQEYIFNKFSQAEESTTRKFGGTGLGLAICKTLVHMMSGSIGVESRLGEGSTFYFNVLLPLANKDDVAEQEETYGVPECDLSEVRILIVDDYQINRDIMHEYVSSWGMYSNMAVTAEEALQKLHKAAQNNIPYHIVLLDYQLPQMDGRILAQAIKSDPVLKDTVLVMVTSAGHLGTPKEMLDMGFSAFLVKPFYPSQLMNVLAIVWDAKLRGKELDLVTQHTVAKALHIEHTLDTVNEKPRFDGIRVLVVEDMPVNQMLMTKILEKIGCRTDTAANGLEAVETLKSVEYDIVFMDCQMPEMDGFDATRAIRKMEAANDNHTIIVALTADAMQGDKEKCLDAGMDDYLNKPVKSEKIEEILRKYCS